MRNFREVISLPCTSVSSAAKKETQMLYVVASSTEIPSSFMAATTVLPFHTPPSEGRGSQAGSY